MENEYYVYAWYFKSTNIVFHIGKGKLDRCYEARKSRNKFFKSIISNYSDDVAVKKLAENLTEQEAWELEKKLIAEYKAIGQCETNFHKGGCGGNTGNYDSPVRHKKLSAFAKSRVGELNPNFKNNWTTEQKQTQSEKIKLLWSEHPEYWQTEKFKNNSGFKKGNISWNLGKTYTKSKMSDSQYQAMMQADCKYKYEVYYNETLIYWCLGHSKLYAFCKEQFNISRTIIDEILNNSWVPKFKKHSYLSTLKIIKIDRSVTTNRDECSGVEWRLLPFEVQGSQ